MSSVSNAVELGTEAQKVRRSGILSVARLYQEWLGSVDAADLPTATKVAA